MDELDERTPSELYKKRNYFHGLLGVSQIGQHQQERVTCQLLCQNEEWGRSGDFILDTPQIFHL